MKTINKICLLSILILSACQQTTSPEGLFIDKFTGVNETSYTDVTYAGLKDTVIVTTYSGRVATRFKDNKKEKLIAQIDDEIYAIDFLPEKNHIAISTLASGILILDAATGVQLQQLPLPDTWALKIGYGEDGNYLFANDQSGNRFVWSVQEDYQSLALPKGLPKGNLTNIKNGVLELVDRSQLTHWSLAEQKSRNKSPLKIYRFTDIDDQGQILSIDHNTCYLYDAQEDSVISKLQHPNWMRSTARFDSSIIRQIEAAGLKIENGYFADPNYQLPLTTAKFAGDKIFTAGIDRSVRIWDENGRQLLESLPGHQATVHQLAVSQDEQQLVSIDLKGGIQFWEVE